MFNSIGRAFKNLFSRKSAKAATSQKEAPVVNLSDSHDLFIQMVGSSIANDNESGKIQRMLFAASNTWEARAHHFIDLTVEFLKQHDRRTGEPDRRKWSKTLYG